MPDLEPDPCKRPGVLHGTAAPLSDALRGALYAAIEAIYAAGGSDTSVHHNAPEPDTGPHAVATNYDAALTPSCPASNPPLEAACVRLTECLKHWESRIEDRSLRGQAAVYHFHPPSNMPDFESRVMGQSMSAADSALITRLRFLCPKVGFEVFPVVLKYTGTTRQYNAWVQQTNGHVEPASTGHNGFWKPYQHVKHSPSVFQFNSFSGPTLAETAGCHEGNVLDERNVAWERARRGLFSWQSPDEKRHFEEERRVREANPKWYQNIIPGTSGDLGHYYAPLEFVNTAEQSQPASHIWQYLLTQCNQSVESAAYFGAVQALCNFVWPKGDDMPTETRILGMQVRDRQEWIDAIDSTVMGDLIMASLVIKDSQLCNSLIVQTQTEPNVDYTWVCEKASVHGYSAAEVLFGLRRFLFKRNNFLQIATIIGKLPAYSDSNDTAEIVSELVKSTLDTLEHPVSASHGRVVVNFLKLFRDFETWSDMVKSALASEPRRLHRHTQFMLGLLNRLLEVAIKGRLPVDEVMAFYQQYAELMSSSHPLWQVHRLVSDATKAQNAEAKAARQAWCIAEPAEELTNDTSEPLPTNHTVIAGLFRNLDRLGMHDQVTNLADHIVQHVAEIEPIHMAPLWLPLLMTLQDLADPETPAFRRLFEAIFERYDEAVFEDVSGRLEQDPGSIPHMAACCSHCEKLDPYFEQPNWKTLHLVRPRAVVDHIETRLREQGKPVKTVVYGKNEANLTMQLTKASLVNEKLRTAGELRRQEATRTVRRFDPARLLPFLEDKEDIMWKLGNAESQEAPENTPAKSSDSPSAGAARLSSISSSSTSDTSLDHLETPHTDPQHRPTKSEAPSSIETRLGGATPKLESHGGPGIVKAGSPSASDLTGRAGHEDIREMFGATAKKEKTTPGGSQGLPRSSGASTRDRLKTFGLVKRTSRPTYDDASAERLRAALDKGRAPRVTPGSSSSGTPFRYSSKAETSAKRTESARVCSWGFGLARSPPPPPLRKGVAGSAGPTPRPSSLAGASGRGLGAGVRKRSPPSSPSPTTGVAEPDYLAAVLGAERAKKRRTGSTWEVRSAAGHVVGSGTSSGKSRFDSLARDKENSRRPSLPGTTARFQPGAAGRAGAASGALATRSPNVRPGTTRIPASAGAKRKTGGDDAVIDLCGGSPSFGAAKKKGKPVFDPLDDDPFGDD
ncbi:hypothetical protein ColLi_06667 [Colletotrichum liriopes]|uniref:Uncharacterized protein n=1 Tax=Colletotrichum liriopes TaxID=708192 RepID=A0AA37LT22_9PEZI|nr:hypothetical protein ColLi_06667 [Colletotrichum liriopes]